MKRSILRSVLGLTTAALALGSLWTAMAAATPGTLKTKNGQSYDGDIKDNGDTYIVTVANVDSQFPKSDVASIQYHGTLDEQVAAKLAKLDPKDADGRVAVARFAFDHSRYDLAIQSLDAALKIDSNNAPALDMLKTVQAQQQLDRGKTVSQAPAEKSPADDVEPTGGPAAPVEKHLLTAADMNAIRQHEIQPGETPQLSFPNDLKRKFAASQNMTFTQFNDLPNRDQLKMILANGDAKTLAAVKVAKDPNSIADFKHFVQPMVLRNCATTGCHGGPAGGKFILYNGSDDATTYTNFYIMQQYTQKLGDDKGVFGSGAQGKLIDRGKGVHSLLVNYALPPDQAETAHPKVAGYNGVFHSRDDRLFNQIVNWMDKGLNFIEPDYGIKYTVPTGAAPTSQPAGAATH